GLTAARAAALTGLAIGTQTCAGPVALSELLAIAGLAVLVAVGLLTGLTATTAGLSAARGLGITLARLTTTARLRIALSRLTATCRLGIALTGLTAPLAGLAAALTGLTFLIRLAILIPPTRSLSELAFLILAVTGL